MQPSVGRIVQFKLGPTWKPAIVVTVCSETELNLAVFSEQAGCSVVQGVRQGVTKGCWRWPPRV